MDSLYYKVIKAIVCDSNDAFLYVMEKATQDDYTVAYNAYILSQPHNDHYFFTYFPYDKPDGTLYDGLIGRLYPLRCDICGKII